MNIFDQLRRDEGLSLTRYVDSLGFGTIGYGHKITRADGDLQEVTTDQANAILISDVSVVVAGLRKALPQFYSLLNSARYGVLVNMAFNMGVNGLLEFHKMLAAMQSQDWKAAAQEMLNSKWATQVGARATRLAEQVRTGEWQ